MKGYQIVSAILHAKDGSSNSCENTGAKTENCEEPKNINMKTSYEINVAAAVIRGYINVNVCKGHGALL